MPTTTRDRRHFKRDFKLGVVKMVTEQGCSVNEAARRFEIDRKSLSEWIINLAPDFKAGQDEHASGAGRQAHKTEVHQGKKEDRRLGPRFSAASDRGVVICVCPGQPEGAIQQMKHFSWRFEGSEI